MVLDLGYLRVPERINFEEFRDIIPATERKIWISEVIQVLLHQGKCELHVSLWQVLCINHFITIVFLIVYTFFSETRSSLGPTFSFEFFVCNPALVIPGSQGPFLSRRKRHWELQKKILQHTLQLFPLLTPRSYINYQQY